MSSSSSQSSKEDKTESKKRSRASSSSSSSDEPEQVQAAPTISIGFEGNENGKKKRDEKALSKNRFKMRVIDHAEDSTAIVKFINRNIQKHVEKLQKKMPANMKQALYDVNQNVKAQKEAAEQAVKDETEEKLKKLKVWENTGNRGQEVISLKAGIENDKKNPKKFKESDFKFQLLKEDNVQVGMKTILETTKEIMTEMQELGHSGVKQFNKPHLIIITPDVSNIEAISKQIIKEFKGLSGHLLHTQNYDIKVTKLWAKNIKPKDYKIILAKKHPNRKVKKVLNIYIGSPARINILNNDEDFTNDKLRYIVVDCRWMDKKEDNTIFENTKCRDDMYNFLIKNKGRISEKVKIALAK